MTLTLYLLLLIVALVLSGVSVVQSPKSPLPWAALVLCVALLIVQIK